MIKIAESKLVKARDLHLVGIRKKIVPLIKRDLEPEALRPIQNFLLQNLDKLITGEPEDILWIHDQYQELQMPLVADATIVDPIIKKIFNYTSFSGKKVEYDAYDLASNLDLRVCSYCNRQYTVTVKRKAKITRPQLDHFYPKSKYPLLALSFYNLIPSCSVCNSTLKGDDDTRVIQIPHPYIDDFNDKVSYDYRPLNMVSAIGASGNLEVKVKISLDCDPQTAIKINNADYMFKLSKIYSAHSEEVQDLIRIKQMYGTEYLYSLSRLTYAPSLATSIDELYNLAFGTYYDPTDFHKRPMSKLKKDILTKLEIV